MRTSLALATATAGVVLAVPAAAVAAPTAVVATGSIGASLALGPDGTAFVASHTLQGEQIAVCRLAFRAKTCATSLPPVPDTPGVGAPDVLDVRILRRPADGVLVLLTRISDLDDASTSPNGDSTWVSTSADSGTTWSPQLRVGLGQGKIGEATLTADGQAIDVIADAPGSAQYSRLPLAGPPVRPARDLRPRDGIATDQTIASLPGGGVVAGFRFANRFGLARLAAGADPVTGWTPWERAGRVRAGEVQQQFRVGPRGLAFLARRDLVKQVYRGVPTFLRFVGPRRVTKGQRVGRGSAQIAPAFDQDPAGGLHVLWANRGSPSQLLYTRTRGPRGRCSFGRQTRQGTVRTTLTKLQLRAASPTRAAVLWENEETRTVRVLWPTGGDAPKPSRRQRC